MGHNYSGNHPRFSMAKPSPLKDSRSEQHKHYMENAVNDLEKGDKSAGEYEASKAYGSSSFKNIGKALTPGAAMGHPGSSLKKGGEPMHGSVSSAMKEIDPMYNGVAGVQQGDFEQYSSSKSSGLKRKPIMKTNQSGGGMLASDPGAAGRELLYNQTKASGLKKTGKELRKEAKLEKTKKQIKEDPTRNSARSKRKLKKLDKTAKQLGAIKIEAGAKPPVSPPKEVRRAAAKNKGEHKGDY